uniref:NADH-ubiquinone oxidoreductase chain 3 n=1 Tax=Sophonia linealis TaxID=2038641 RepID=A0A343K7Z9_9HEMI|nr:NADH dehydrogenase subunit 3 [Sophonia linealis]
MKLLLINLILILLLTSIIFMLILTVSKKSTVNMQKLTPFECGFNPISYKRLPFSIHFFLIAVIFLVFDIEVVIIMPTIMIMKYSITMYWILTNILFLIILMIGLFHEWMNGMLNWTV